MNKFLKPKYVMEAIGTFFIVFTLAMAFHGGGQIGAIFAPLAVGAMYAIMILVGGKWSGGYFNPAVTLAMFLRGTCKKADVPIYMGAQVLGAVVAGFLALVIHDFPGTVVDDVSIWKALIVELLFSFVLVYVVLNVAAAKGTEGSPSAGWAIGLTVLAGMYAVGSLSGGAFNPAVAIGGCVAKVYSWAYIWIYLITNLAGGAAAAYAFKFMHSEASPSADPFPSADVE